MAKIKELTPEEVNIVYAMCGQRASNAEFTADIFNAVLKLGGNFSLMDAAKIRVKHESKVAKFRPLNRASRNYIFYKRNK